MSEGISDVGCRISGDSSQPPEPATFTKSHPKSDIRNPTSFFLMNYDSISSEGVKGFRTSDVGSRVIRASRQNLRRSPSHPKSDIRNPTSFSYELRFDQQ